MIPQLRLPVTPGATSAHAAAPQTALPAIPNDRIPRHIAMVMDGNGRWATQRGLTRTDGHAAGRDAVFPSIDAALALGVPYLSVYAFSTENWRRAPDEVAAILVLIENFLRDSLSGFIDRGVRLRWRGRENGLPPSLVQSLRAAEEATAGGDRMLYTICVNYGSRAEIADAARLLAQGVRDGRLDADTVDEETLDKVLTEDLPPVDLFIRPGGEQRMSNFLLWHSAYAELVFHDRQWPDVDRHTIRQAVRDYTRRTRRFGTVLPPQQPLTARTTAVSSDRPLLSHRLAQTVSDVFDPKYCVLLTTLLIGWHAERLIGIGWSILTALFTVAGPAGLVLHGQRRGRWDDRHLPHRQDRLRILPAILASVLTGLLIAGLLGAPRETTALVAAMFVSLTLVLIITTRWKVSLHTAVGSGTVATLTIAYGTPVLAFTPLIALIAWSRIRLNAHTTAQTIAGAVLGATAGGSIFAFLH